MYDAFLINGTLRAYTVCMDSFLFFMTLALSYHDLKDHRLPNALVYGLLVGAVLQDPVQALAGWLGMGFMAILYGLARGGLGFGDVKLYGALCAYLGAPAILPLFTLSFLMAGAVSLVMVIKKGTTAQVIPFGPFLCLSALLIR